MRYYTTVSYMHGHNKKIDELNLRMSYWKDNLVTSVENVDTIREMLQEMVVSLNEKYPRCSEITLRQYSSIITIGYHNEQCASITFHEIKRVI